jgi:hypothetical protein
MRITFDGAVMVENGDIIEVLRGIPSRDNHIRATKIRNVTRGGWEKRSRIDGTLMTVLPRDFNPPIKGKIRNLSFPGSDTEFDLMQGDYLDDHIFVRAGDRARGREAIGSILKNELIEYVKICDPYINEQTFDILRDVPIDIPILILYEKAGGSANDDTVQSCLQEQADAGRTIRIKRRKGRLHSRYILTSGCGWAIGHSLKDVGDKDTTIDKMKSCRDVEEEFDRHWAES